MVLQQHLDQMQSLYACVFVSKPVCARVVGNRLAQRCQLVLLAALALAQALIWPQQLGNALLSIVQLLEAWWWLTMQVIAHLAKQQPKKHAGKKGAAASNVAAPAVPSDPMHGAGTPQGEPPDPWMLRQHVKMEAMRQRYMPGPQGQPIPLSLARAVWAALRSARMLLIALQVVRWGQGAHTFGRVLSKMV